METFTAPVVQCIFAETFVWRPLLVKTGECWIICCRKSDIQHPPGHAPYQLERTLVVDDVTQSEWSYLFRFHENKTMHCTPAVSSAPTGPWEESLETLMLFLLCFTGEQQFKNNSCQKNDKCSYNYVCRHNSIKKFGFIFGNINETKSGKNFSFDTDH